MVGEYHKSKLSARSQACYESLLDAFARMQSVVPCKGNYVQDIADVYMAVYKDHPELFYLSPALQIGKKQGFFTSEINVISPFIFSEGEILQYRVAMDKIVKSLSIQANKCASEKEIEKIVCDYIIKNVTYEINVMQNQNAATALIKGKGQCSGIAKAVKVILDYLDIECILVEGTAEDGKGGNGPHCWNIVNIDGQYYHLDVTFMLGANMSKIEPFRYPYLNYSDKQIETNHQWDRKKYPACNTPSTTGTPPLPARPSMPNRPSYSVPQSQSVGKTISSYVEFRREIGKVYDKKETKLCFVSEIPSKDLQDLIDCLLKEAMDEAENRNIGFSINISAQGKAVTVDIIWT